MEGPDRSHRGKRLRPQADQDRAEALCGEKHPHHSAPINQQPSTQTSTNGPDSLNMGPAHFISMDNIEPKKTPRKSPHEFKVMRVRECLPAVTMVDTPELAAEYWKIN